MLPITLNLREKTVLVVGGGRTAVQKIRRLRKTDAKILVVAPQIRPEISQHRDLRTYKRAFRTADLTGVFLVIVATANSKLNERIARIARQRKILVNVVDEPRNSDILFTAEFSCGDLQIAVSTCGASPRLAQLVRTELKQKYDQPFTTLLKFLRSAREILKTKLPTSTQRKSFWQRHLTTVTLRKLRRGENNKIQNEITSRLKKL